MNIWMMAGWMFVSLCLFSLYLWERRKYLHLHRELLYLDERLRQVRQGREGGYILVPSDNPAIKSMAAEVNRMLEKYYRQKTDYDRTRRSMQQVLTNISHDLRTPLTVLKGYSEMLQNEIRRGEIQREGIPKNEIREKGIRQEHLTEKASPGNLSEMAEKIYQKADEMASLMEDFFTLSKLESGDSIFHIQKINLVRICHDVLLDYYNLLEENQFHVDIEIPEEPCHVMADGEAVTRILKNLLDNAVKYGDSGQYLAVRLSQNEEKVQIEVEDHGEGIPVEDQERIFLRTYTKGRGSGLGLSIARNLAGQMQADLFVHSKKGRGAVFRLVFNACPEK